MHASLLGFCLESLVLGDDMLGQVLRCVRGIEVTEDAVSVDVIRQTCLGGPGHYLGSDQTLRLMQTDYVYPAVADRMSPKEWNEKGRPGPARPRDGAEAAAPGGVAAGDRPRDGPGGAGAVPHPLLTPRGPARPRPRARPARDLRLRAVGRDAGGAAGARPRGGAGAVGRGGAGRGDAAGRAAGGHAGRGAGGCALPRGGAAGGARGVPRARPWWSGWASR